MDSSILFQCPLQKKKIMKMAKYEKIISQQFICEVKKKLYGTLRFNCMIPVPHSELSEYKINDKGDFNYKMLMLAEYNFCKDNREKIEKTAKNLYEKKCNLKEVDFPVAKVVIDFKKVEKACAEFGK